MLASTSIIDNTQPLYVSLTRITELTIILSISDFVSSSLVWFGKDDIHGPQEAFSHVHFTNTPLRLRTIASSLQHEEVRPTAVLCRCLEMGISVRWWYAVHILRFHMLCYRSSIHLRLKRYSYILIGHFPWTLSASCSAWIVFTAFRHQPPNCG